MSTNQQPQPDWAEQLANTIGSWSRNSERPQENLFDSGSTLAKESAALIRAEFEKHERAKFAEYFARKDEQLESDSIVATCECMTKTPEAKYHKPGCKYRLICERDEARNQLAALETVCAKQKEALENCVEKLNNYANRQWVRKMKGNSFGDGTVANPRAGEHYRAVQSAIDSANACAKLTPADVADKIANLQAELKAAKEATQWQPIETAPKCELVVVMWLDDGEAIHAFDIFENDCWMAHNNAREHFVCCAPAGSAGPGEDAPYTHWMPLPPAPDAARGKEVQ